MGSKLSSFSSRKKSFYKPMGVELQAPKRGSAVSFSWQFNYCPLILISLLFLSCFSGVISYVFFSKFLSLPVLVLSTFAVFLFLPYNREPKKGRPSTEEKLMEEEVLSSRDNQNKRPEMEVSSCSDSVSVQEHSESKVLSCRDSWNVAQEIWVFEQEKKTLNGDEDYGVDQIKEGLVGSIDFLSESSCLSSSNSDQDDFELDLLSESDHYPCSDSNDEENLIEIALPEGNYLRPEETKQIFRPNQPEFSPESFFGPSLMELFSELTEEDNLIEIDISMGSIKCPGFEIQA